MSSEHPFMREMPETENQAKSNCTGTAAKASSTADVPRSVVQHLESEIARLETELLQDGQFGVVHASDILLGLSSSVQQPREPRVEATRGSNPIDSDGSPGTQSSSLALRNAIVSGKPLQSIVSETLPNGSGAADLLSRIRMGITPSTAKVREGGNRTATVNPKANKGSILLSPVSLSSMPWEIIQRLMRKFLNTIHADNPFLVASEVTQQFQTVHEVLKTQAVAQSPDDGLLLVNPSHDFLIVYLVLAITVTLGSATDKYEERRMSLSVSLFEEGIQHLYSLQQFPSDIAWLQTILLVLLYATVFPRSANVWVLSGAAMRCCVELGLHREPPASMGLDSDSLDLRRSVFWAAYCLDRSICSALQRPLSTPDAAINTQLPSRMQDSFLGSIAYHKLLSEILHVHFQREPIPAELTWDDWLSSMEERLRSWNKFHSEASSHHEAVEFTMARGLMILHRPSPQVPLPSQKSLLIAFEAASTAERIHHEHIKVGFFRRPWLSAHYTLEAATVVLFCLRHGYAAIVESFSTAQIFEMTKLFTSNFLAIAAHGWPEVVGYAGAYERLLGPLLERVFLQTPTLSDRFGPAQDAELMRLLYPGPAHLESLRFGLQGHEEQYSPFNFNMFLMDDDLWDAGLTVTNDGPGEREAHRWEWACVQQI